MAEAQAEPRRLDWIVRAAGDRALHDDEENPASAGLLRAEVMMSEVLFTKTITVRAREPKVACVVVVSRVSRVKPKWKCARRGSRCARYAAAIASCRC